jgi:hypothetical protein
MTNLQIVLGWLGALVCVGAGVYLLQWQSASDTAEQVSWFTTIGHGIGIYFIGKGLFVASQQYKAETR